MRVDGSSQGGNAEMIARIQEQVKLRGSAKAETVQSGSPGKAAVAPEAAPTGQDGGERGVIRLLQEGHFRGVADVRLRINFADELQGIEAANSSATVKDGIAVLQKELNTAIDAFVEGGTLSEEDTATLRSAQEAFNTQLGALLESDAPSSEVFGDLRTAFEDFLKGLIPPQEVDEESIIAVESVETVEEAPVPVTTEPVSATPLESPEITPPTDVFSGLRETLGGLFDSAVSSLQDSLDALKLPPLSEPNGNGGAYDKFLATYNELYGVGGGTESPVPEEVLNTTA
jgi:hypothetical protein